MFRRRHKKKNSNELLQACREKPPAIAKILPLLQACPEAAQQADEHGVYPIHYATSNRGSLHVIACLVQAWPQSVRSVATSLEALPLHLACADVASLPVIKYLTHQWLEAVHEIDNDGKTPLDYAKSPNRDAGPYPEIVDWLERVSDCLNEGGVPRPPVTMSMVPVKVSHQIKDACYDRPPSLQKIKRILKAHPDAIKTGGDEGIMPLLWACDARASLVVVEYLYEAYPGAIQARPSWAGDDLPIHAACAEGCTLDVIQFLVREWPESGFALNQNGQSPLYMAQHPSSGSPLRRVVQYLESLPPPPQRMDEQFQLAQNYFYGKNGYEKDYTKALELYRRGHEVKHAPSTNRLGECYQVGIGLKSVDSEMAFDMFATAAQQGNVDATFSVGYSFLRGIGTEKNLTWAYKMIREAAEQGHREATARLAEMYEEGNGVERNPKAAWYWYEKTIELLTNEMNSSQDLQSRAFRLWDNFGGPELEPALQSGAIALLDAQWLINFALFPDGPTVLPCRQELPKEAFLSMDQIKLASSEEQELQVIALSYMWLHPEHPDPHGHTLRLLANYCYKMLTYNIHRIPGDLSYMRFFPRFAIFWDYASLYQHHNGVRRTPVEDRLFRQGLDGLVTFFSHPHAHVFKVTQFPDQYPRGYNLPSGANTMDYHKRGWPLFESSCASMTKDGRKTRDICREKVDQYHAYSSVEKSRQAPLLPNDLEETLGEATFTNAKEDRPLVLRLYQAEFANHFARVKTMNYSKLGWDDEQVIQLTKIIGSGYTPSLTHLDLSRNKMGPSACQSLALALTGSALEVPQLLELNLRHNPSIDNDGIDALSKVFLQIPIVMLTNTGCSVAGCQSIVQATKSARTAKIECLLLDENAQIGDEGVQVLADFCVRYIKEVSFDSINCGNRACHALEVAIRQCHQVRIESISLGKNPNIDSVGFQALDRLLQNHTNLQSLCVAGRTWRQGQPRSIEALLKS